MRNRKDNKGKVLEKGEYQKPNSTYIYKWTDINGKRQSICSTTLENLRKKKMDIIKEISIGVIRDNTTVEELIELYLQEKHDVAMSTMQNYWYYFHKMIAGTSFARLRIVDVKKNNVIFFYNDYFKKGVKKGTLKWLQRMLNPAFNMAVENDRMYKNPCCGALNSFKNDEKKKQCLSIEQELEFITRIKNTDNIRQYLPMYKIELLLGLRIGELLGLTWSDVDFEERVININHQLNYRGIGGKAILYISKTKTESSNRVFPMTDELLELFNEQRVLCEKLNNRKEEYEIDGYKNFVFLSHVTGRPLYPSNVRRQMKRIKHMEKINVDLPEDLSPHSLRHCFITRMAESGCDIKSLMYLSGHTKLDTIMNIYNHVDDERIKRDLENSLEKRMYYRTIFDEKNE